jgi:hypothetical protein
VAKRKDGKKITSGPLEAGLYKIPSRFGHYPGEKRPRHAVHRKPMLVEMEKWRGHIEHNLLPQNTISWRGKPVRPRMEKRDSGAAPLGRRGFEVFHAPENLHASMTKRSAEHSVSRQENGLEIACEERASGWIFQEVWRSGTRFHLIPAEQWLRSRGHLVRLEAELSLEFF